MISEKRVLILFEGKEDRKRFRYFYEAFSDLLSSNGYETTILSTSIYELYEPLIASGDYDDLPSYLYYKGLIEIEPGRKPNDQFALIYLVFDFDPCYHTYSPDKIRALVSYFSDETRNGLLYVNYPMVEAHYDFHKENDRLCLCKERPLSLCTSDSYKKAIRKESCLRGESGHLYHRLPFETLCKISLLILSRYRELLGLEEENQWSFSDQKALLEVEIRAFEKETVYPLGCLPIMAMDYNPIEAMKIWKGKE